ncbi:MAG: hypothetical protein CSB44_11930 [Gammaproteobacteria bacterium]|nr:MAG: hypothetical protein CSB44_11930 [Gammaproteobacteria bacterium]
MEGTAEGIESACVDVPTGVLHGWVGLALSAIPSAAAFADSVAALTVEPATDLPVAGIADPDPTMVVSDESLDEAFERVSAVCIEVLFRRRFDAEGT